MPNAQNNNTPSEAQPSKQLQAIPKLAFFLKRKKQFRFFLFLVFFAAALFLFCGGMTIYRASIIDRQYQKYLAVADSTDYSQKTDSYKAAIKLVPNRTEGYFKLLDAYEEDGIFDADESAEFTVLYNKSTGNLKPEQAAVELNYRAGKMYLNIYAEGDTQVPLSTRIQKAYSYFERNHNSKNQTSLSECYYVICAYYKDYILQKAETKEITPEAIDSLLAAAESALSLVASSETYDQLMLYSTICNFLYDQRAVLARTAQMERVISLLDAARTATESLTPTVEKSITLRERILTATDTYKTSIELAFHE